MFVSHAGNSADKPFARAAAALLERTGWGLRVFLDDDSLVPGGAPGQVRNPSETLKALQALKALVIVGLRLFLDDDSLVPGGAPG